MSLDVHGIPRPLRHHRERGLLVEQPVWGWHCLWVYALCILLLVFAAVYTEGEVEVVDHRANTTLLALNESCSCPWTSSRFLLQAAGCLQLASWLLAAVTIQNASGRML